MSLLEKLDQSGIDPQISRPERLISGDPVHTTWNMEDRDGLYCGIWQSTAGAWRVEYTEWEYFNILSGYSILTEDDGTVTHLNTGDSFVIRPGFRGIWTVIETTVKDYVIRL
jgi:uncharacterized cupin superfamily protein